MCVELFKTPVGGVKKNDTGGGRSPMQCEWAGPPLYVPKDGDQAPGVLGPPKRSAHPGER